MRGAISLTQFAVVAHSEGLWGKGETLEKAIANCKTAVPSRTKKKIEYIVFGSDGEITVISDVMFRCFVEPGKTLVKFIIER